MTTQLSSEDLSSAQSDIVRGWAEELQCLWDLLPTDLSKDQFCRRLILEAFFDNQPVDFIEPWELLHRYIDDFSDPNFPDPEWEEAYERAWHQIGTELYGDDFKDPLSAIMVPD